MAQFDVKVTETFSKLIRVEAEDSNDAIHIVTEKWEQEKIILGSSNFDDVIYENVKGPL